MQKRLANGLGPPPCSLHYRVERSCGPRFVGASRPADAKSLGLAFVRTPWRRLCRAGGVTRTGVGRGGVWSAATAWVGEPAGTRLAERGKPNLDRAGGGRLILKPDCEGEGRRHSFKAVRWCAARRGRGWVSLRASFVPGATGRPGPGGVRSGDNAGRRGLGEGRAGGLAPGWPLGSGAEPARRLAQRRDFEQGAHALEPGATARMQPGEAAHAMKAARQHVLEEATEELEGLQVDLSPGAGAAVAKGPAQPPIGQELEWAVAGSGFEHVTAEVAQSVLAAAGGGAVNDPALLPHFGREVGQRLGHLLFECFPE